MNPPLRGRGRLAHYAIRLLALGATHVWMALNVAGAMNGLLAVLYLLFPPLALFALGGQVERFATFAMAVVIVWLLLCTATAWACRRRLAALPAAAWLLLAPVPLVWLPVASAEIVRALAMDAAVAEAKPDCHERSSFITSMHALGERGPAHAWMVVDGSRYIWSYSEFGFVREQHRPPHVASCPARGRPD